MQDAASATAHPTAGLVLIGDELLSGKVEDTNGPYLVSMLRRHGIDLREIHVVGDDVDEIVEVVNLVRSRRSHCFTSGGIGPTHDDVTMEAVANAFGVPLEERPDLVTIVESFFGIGEQGKAWRKMASVPTNTSLLHTGTTWPLYTVDNVYVLPGIPEIFRRQVQEIVATIDGVPVTTNVAYFRIGEGALAGHLTELAEDYVGVVAIGSYPLLSHPDYKVKVTLESRDVAVLEVATQRLLDAFPGDDVHGIDRGV